jgi:hypothetical protein
MHLTEQRNSITFQSTPVHPDIQWCLCFPVFCFLCSALSIVLCNLVCLRPLYCSLSVFTFLCSVLLIICLSFCPFPFGLYIICSPLIYFFFPIVTSKKEVMDSIFGAEVLGGSGLPIISICISAGHILTNNCSSPSFVRVKKS